MIITELVDYIQTIVTEVNEKTNDLAKVVGMSEIIEMLRAYDITRGKKLRSVLCCLVSDALTSGHKAAIDYAIAIELTHQASLVHDDVIDGDKFRRNQLTMSERYGVGKAILAGDMLISFAINAIKDMSPIEFAVGARRLAPAWMKLAEGAYIEHMFGEKPTLDSYYKMIEYKTGVLFEAAGGLGAVSGRGNDDTVKRYSAYGLACGLAFQMTDDLVDVLRSKNSGKFEGDLKDRRITLPILAIMNGDVDQLVEMYIKKVKMTDEQQVAFLKLLEDKSAIEETKNVIENTVNAAVKYLEVLPPSDYKSMLIEFPQYIVQSLMLEIRC